MRHITIYEISQSKEYMRYKDDITDLSELSECPSSDAPSGQLPSRDDAVPKNIMISSLCGCNL